MIRPEPPQANVDVEASRFWDAQYAGPGKFFSVGNIVRIEASPPPPNFPFPHASEDRIYVDGSGGTVLRRAEPSQISQLVAAGVSASLETVFDGKLFRAHSGKAYVTPGERTVSLGAIEIAPDQISFYEENPAPGKRRLRAQISQGDREYDLSVPADAARTRFLTGGIAALEADAKASKLIHVRVGLCRPFNDVPCYAQVNGIYFL
jgi:hypothetical protein